MRVEADGDLVALESGFDSFGRLSVVTGAGVKGEHPVGDLEAQRSVAFGHKRDTADGFTQYSGLDDGMDRNRIREQRPDFGVFALDEQRRGDSARRGERDQILASVGAQTDGDISAEGLRDIGECASPQQSNGRDVGTSRVPVNSRTASR